MIDSKIFSENIQESFNWLIELGYKFKQIDTNIYFERLKKDEAFAIGFSWSEYSRILVNGVTFYKRFDVVENILHEVNNGVQDYTIKQQWQGDVPQEFDKVKEQDYFSNAFYISNISEIRIFSSTLKKVYNEEVTGFLDNFKTLQDVLGWLGENDIQKHSDLLVANNNLMMLRKLVIMKEGHSPEYEDLYKRYSSFLKKKQAEGESPYIEMFDNYLKLESYFNHPA
nr:hypothetical protein [uncultured Carboxylicivirga sp.]